MSISILNKDASRVLLTGTEILLSRFKREPAVHQRLRYRAAARRERVLKRVTRDPQATGFQCDDRLPSVGRDGDLADAGVV